MAFLLWIIAVVLVVSGIVALFRRQPLWASSSSSSGCWSERVA
jgi:hypothetical protein